jgi:hypothetical protein
MVHSRVCRRRARNQLRAPTSTLLTGRSISLGGDRLLAGGLRIRYDIVCYPYFSTHRRITPTQGGSPIGLNWIEATNRIGYAT